MTSAAVDFFASTSLNLHLILEKLARKANCVYKIRPKNPFEGDTEIGSSHISKEIHL